MHIAFADASSESYKLSHTHSCLKHFYIISLSTFLGIL